MKKILLIIVLLTTSISASEKVNYLESLSIENYDINFNKNKYEYGINIGEEDSLNIQYELSDDSKYVSIIGNGNFNKTDNVIKININNDYEYTIHAYKSINVSYIEEENIPQELSKSKKEIVIILLITISSIIIFGFYYTLFINKTTLHI